MRVFEIESHEDSRAPKSFRYEFWGTAITPKFLKGFESRLIQVLGEMQPLVSDQTEVVAGVLVQRTATDGLWTTGYQEHLTLTKGQTVLGGYSLSLWLYGKDGPVSKLGDVPFVHLHDKWREVDEDETRLEHVLSEMKRRIHIHIKDCLATRIRKINAAVTEHELKKLDLLKEHRLLSGFCPD